MKKDNFKVGEKVEWHYGKETIQGTVEKKLTHSTQIKGHHVSADKDNPQYLVKSDKTKKVAAHKPDSLTRTGK